MKRLLAASLVFTLVLWVGPVRAADSLKESLSAVPGDAVLVVGIPSLADLDADYQNAVAKLGLGNFIPPPMNSLIGALKMNAPMLSGIDESRAVFVVMMPADTIFEMQMRQAIVLPAKDPKAMIEALGGTAGEDDLYTVQFFGTPSQATIVKDRVIIARLPDVAKAVRSSAAGLDGKLSADELKTLAGLDVFLWLDAKRLVEIARPMIDGMLMPMLTAGAAQGGISATSAEMNKRNLQMLLDGASTMAFGIGLGDAGLGFRFGMTVRSGSELHARSKMETASDGLLRGLATCDYITAFGQTMHPDTMKSAAEDLQGLAAFAEGNEKLDKQKIEKLQKLVSDMVPMIGGVRGTVEGLPPGPDGLFGMTLIFDTSDSARWTGLFKDVLAMGKQVAADVAKAEAEDAQDQIQALLDALTFSEGAETVGGVAVSHLRFELSKIAETAELDEEEIDRVKKLIGKEGLLFRVVPVDGKQVMMTFGGGEARAAKAIEAAKSSAAPLESTPGIKKVDAHLPGERTSVFYLSVDRIVRTVQAVQKTMDEEVLPIQMPPLDAPIGVASTGGEGWSRVDFFIPMDLIVAGKNAAMAMMGAGGAAPPPAAGGPAGR